MLPFDFRCVTETYGLCINIFLVIFYFVFTENYLVFLSFPHNQFYMLLVFSQSEFYCWNCKIHFHLILELLESGIYVLLIVVKEVSHADSRFFTSSYLKLVKSSGLRSKCLMSRMLKFPTILFFGPSITGRPPIRLSFICLKASRINSLLWMLITWTERKMKTSKPSCQRKLVCIYNRENGIVVSLLQVWVSN